jgi:hypothetical protein
MSFGTTKLILIVEHHNTYNPYLKTAFHTWIDTDKIDSQHRLLMEGLKMDYYSVRNIVLKIFRNKHLWDSIYDCDGRYVIPNDTYSSDLSDDNDTKTYLTEIAL